MGGVPFEWDPPPWVSHGLIANPRCHSSQGNAPSADANVVVISAFVEAQIRAGHMAGPFHPSDCSGVLISQMAAIPKKTPRKWRVIVNLLAPQGQSVNDNLHRQLSHVSYSSPSDAAMILYYPAPGTLMAKIDRRDAYRMVPIHPGDRPFLGIS